MSGGGGQTTTQRSEPWDGQKPYITEGYGEAQRLYNQGPAQYYPGSTVADQSDTTRNALSAIEQRGMSGADGRSRQQYALNQFGEGNLGDWGVVDQMRNLGGGNSYLKNPAVSGLSGMAADGSGLGVGAAKRVGDISAAGANSLAQYRGDVGDIITGYAQSLNPALAPIMATAGGGYLAGSPYLDAMYGKAASGLTRQFAEGVSPGLDSAASRAGRYGSGMHANVKDAAGESFGRQLGDLATGIYGQNYEAERQRQEAATANASNIYQQGLALRANTAATSAGQGATDANLRLAASGQIGQGQAQDAANQLAANEQLSRAYESGADRQLQALNSSNAAYNASRAQQLQALGLQPAYQQMDYTDLNNASAAGQARDQYSQQLINADIARHDFGQNAGWQNLSRYLAAINGGSPGASVTTTGGGGGLGGLGSIFAGLGGLGQLATGTRGLLW